MNFAFVAVADNYGNLISSEPGRFVGPLAAILGVVFNFIFELFNNNVTLGVALGLSIIIITFIMRTLILPLALKSHKSMMKMHRISPEVNAIKQKYEGRTSPEDKRKMQVEIQQLYSTNKINPFMGCLPMLLTMPVFFGLNFIMRQTHLYVNALGDVYTRISSYLIEQLPVSEYLHFWTLRIYHMIPSNFGRDFIPGNVDDMSRAVSTFTAEQWDSIREAMSTCGNVVYECICNNVAYLNALLDERTYIETFLVFNLTQNAVPSLSFGGIFQWGLIIPLLSVVTMFLTSYLMQRTQRSNDPAQKMQQRIMLFGMPIFFAFITGGMPMGVGIYWVASNIYQVGQHYALTKYYANREL